MPDSPEPATQPGPPLADRRRSPANNALQSTLAFLYPVVLTIVLTPLILHHIGAEEYGIFALAMVFVGFLGLIDIGMGPVVLRFLSASLATSDMSEARLVLGVGCTFFFSVGLIGLLVALIAGQFVPDILSLSPEMHSTATFVISVAGVGFFFTAFRSPYTAIPGALQRLDTATTANLISTTAAAAGTVTVLSLGGGVRALIIVTALQPALMLLLVARSNKRLMPELSIRPMMNRPLLRRMMSFSSYSFISNIAGVVLFEVDKFVLGALSNVSLVTYYVIPGSVAQRLHVGMSKFTAIALPVSADLHARGDRAALNAFYVRATRAIGLMTVCLVVPAFVFARQLLDAWIGKSFADTSFGTLRILLITYALLAVTTLSYYVTLGVGRPRVPAVFNVVTAILNVGLMVILIPRYGLIGAAVAYLGSAVTVPFLILYVERRVLVLGRSPWPALILRLGLVAVGQAACCLLLRPLATGLPQVIALLFLGVAIGPAVAAISGYLTPDDRATLSRLIRFGRGADRRGAVKSVADQPVDR